MDKTANDLTHPTTSENNLAENPNDKEKRERPQSTEPALSLASGSGDAPHEEDQHENLAENSNKKRKQDRNKPSTNVLTQQVVHSFPASTYLQGLATLPQNYSNFLSSMDCTNAAFAANPFLTGTASFDTPRTSGAQDHVFDSMKHNGHDVLGKKLNQMDVLVLKQLITGYRDAAALLNRTADELEHLTSYKH